MGVIRGHKSALSAEMMYQFPLALVEGNAQARPGLMQIDEHSGAFVSNGLQRGLDQFLAVAIERTEDVSVGAMRMHPHQDVGSIGNVPVDERQVAFSVHAALVANGAELAERCAQMSFGFAFNEALGL